MKIHYNNGSVEKIIDNVIAVQVIGVNEPVIAIMANGNELRISLDNIEMILDDSITEKQK